MKIIVGTDRQGLLRKLEIYIKWINHLHAVRHYPPKFCPTFNINNVPIGGN